MEKKKQGITYRDAGVDIDAKTAALQAAKKMVAATFNKHVLSGIGHFGTLFDLSGLGGASPVLVASADGVGTKLKVAAMAGRYDTVGIDLVNHCVNDIAVQGATPLFFLDYIASGVFDPRVFQEMIEGLAEGCRANGLALVGGETAEMPGFYPEGEHELAGFIVGIVERSRIVDGRGIQEGDLLIGLRSSGLHTNGYSLVRKLLFEVGGMGLEDQPEGLERSLGEELLVPHRSYLEAVRKLNDRNLIKGMAHITGGGITDNLPRVIPEGLTGRVRFGTWPVLPIFDLMTRLGDLSPHESLKVFNMGVGFVVVVSPEDLEKAMTLLSDSHFEADVIGDIVKGGKIIYEGI